MIAHLRGTVFSKGIQRVVIDVNGVGYAVTMSSRSIDALGPVGGEALVYVSMQVREDGVTLFGFTDEDERFVFEKLITVSGVGPKVAISALSTFSAPELMRMIGSEDSARMSKVPGIGKKTAQRIVVDLKGAFGQLAGQAPLPGEDGAADPAGSSEATAALLSMGFTAEEAQLALKGYTGSDDVSEMIRHALKRLGS